MIKRDTNRQARLFHTCGSESRRTDNISGSENVRHLRAAPRVDLHEPAFAWSQSGSGKIQVGGVALPA